MLPAVTSDANDRPTGPTDTPNSAPTATCARDLKASTAASVERINNTSVNSAPICKPHPIPEIVMADGGDHVPSDNFATTKPVPYRPVNINPAFTMVKNTTPNNKWINVGSGQVG